ncbi:SusC/RagA family TonB-linked outer membrane protein [Pedobacter deserti]|uniref:SusC/RagA family TonB-linked outer membrane protein n=1 Tax=Pedobacter deserti TaxID=2817382 RepID=UPI00210D5938|nr:SusC/RagA family TonB-linked outer membrane protein [Pedobacter sp. SYSU D00382]
MKITAILLFAFCMQLSATVRSQITLSEKDAPLTQILEKIQEQSGYNLFYKDKLINDNKLNIKLNNVSLEQALNEVFRQQNLTFELVKNTIVVKRREENFLDRLVEALKPPIDVKGTVYDEKGVPIPGVTIKVKGTNKYTTTDDSGVFYLPGTDDRASIQISYVGYKTQELPASANFSNIRLEMGTSELDEVVVAYGRTTQQALTGSVTVVRGEQIQNLPNRSFDKSLQGLVPGLQITNGTGQPGGNTANLVLRGIATGADLSQGSIAGSPLFVIDGTPVTNQTFQANPARVTQITNPLAQINPSDIESISVLKDASAIALYGARAGNGVILVTTKKGKAGKTIFNFRSQLDFASRMDGKTEVLNQQDYLSLLYQTYKNTNAANWTDEKILADLKAKFPVRSDGTFYPAPDWDDAVYERAAYTTSNEISMSGGSHRNTYYVNLEYSSQNGAVKNTGYDRQSLRINLENRPADFFKLGLNSTFSYNSQDFSNAFSGTDGFALSKIISPLNPVRSENGQYILVYPFGLTSQAVNPAAQSEYNINNNTAYRGLASINGELTLFKSLTLKSLLGVDFMLAESKFKNSPVFLAASPSTLPPSIRERDVKRSSIINSNTLTYNKVLSDIHAVTLLVGGESQMTNQKDLGAEVIGTKGTLDFYDQLSSPGYTQNAYAGYATRQTQLSWFAQANYGFDSKYYFTGSIRGDGSSRFGDDQRWGTFWSAGLGWILSNETFLKDRDRWLSYLKIRGSIGAAGNASAIDAYTRFDRIGIAYFDGSQALLPSSTPGNPDIQWEATTTWDIGLESRFLHNRISLTMDYYQRNTRDLIFPMNLSSFAGYPSVPGNIGNIRNEGLEIQMNTSILKGKSLSWDLGGNWSRNENILIKANVPIAQILTGNIGREEGRNFNAFYIPVWAGVDQQTGRPQWLKADGTITNTYAQGARQFVGKPQPDGFGSIINTLRYRDLQLSVSLYYQYGSKIFDNASRTIYLNDGRSPYVNQSVQAMNYWQKSGDTSPNPRRLLNNTDRGNEPSTRYLFSGDYLRIQNVVLDYGLPDKLISRARLQSARVYLQGNNLAVFTKYKGADPDNTDILGNNGFAYPNARVFSIGLNARF